MRPVAMRTIVPYTLMSFRAEVGVDGPHPLGPRGTVYWESPREAQPIEAHTPLCLWPSTRQPFRLRFARGCFAPLSMTTSIWMALAPVSYTHLTLPTIYSV